MKNRIHNVVLNRLRNEAHFGFHSECVKLVSDYGLTEAFQALVDQYNSHYDELDTALKVIRKSVQTGQMKRASMQRRVTFRQLCSVVEGFLKHADPAKQLAAERINNVIRTYYKDLTRGSYDEKTYAFHNMFQDLRTATVSADLLLLGLTSWVSDLEANNLECKKLKEQRYGIRMAQPTQKVADARKALDADYQAVAEYLGSYVVLHPDDDNAATLVTALNTRVDAYGLLLSRPRGKRTPVTTPADSASSSSSSGGAG